MRSCSKPKDWNVCSSSATIRIWTAMSLLLCDLAQTASRRSYRFYRWHEVAIATPRKKSSNYEPAFGGGRLPRVLLRMQGWSIDQNRTRFRRDGGIYSHV